MRERQQSTSTEDDTALRMAVVSAGGHIKTGIPPFVQAGMEAAETRHTSAQTEA